MISEKEWSVIRQHDSIGLNFWVLHDFIPTYFCFEEARHSDRRNAFYSALEKRADEFAGTPFIIKDLLDSHVSFERIPGQLMEDMFLSVDFDVQIRGDDTLMSRYLDTLRSMGRLEFGHGLRCLYGMTASISYLLFFALQAGYTRIVLCGVDLSDSRYFYEENADYYLAKGLTVPETMQSVGVHSTAQRTETKIPITDVVRILDDQVLRPAGMELLIGKKYGAFATLYPAYFADTSRP